MRAVVYILLGCFATVPAFAAEGMWTLDNLPKQALKDKYGFEPDQAWVDKVMHASVRLAGGCSGSFVSPDGLVLTNHHCAAECVQQLSSAKKDYLRDGFIARNAGEEKMCPQIELNRLDQITDVTARVKAATGGQTGKAFSDALKAEKARIESECTGGASDVTRCDVVELYHGGLYHLYKYRRFQDVRLVFAPEFATAFFGGDPDNFNFPRYDLDFSLLRAYDHGQPAKVKDYFHVNPKGAEEGELVMVTGHPGATQRLLTVSQLTTLRDVDLISRLLYLSEARGLLTRYGQENAENARVAEHDLFSVENSYKALYGMLQALLDPAVFDLKRKQEAELRAAIAKDPKMQAQYGQAWDEIAQAQARYRQIEARYKLIELRRGFLSRYFEIARTLVRAAEELLKPNPERLREYTDANLPSLKQDLFSNAPIYPKYEKVRLAWSLTKLREQLGADDPLVKLVLGGASPEQLASKLVDGTRLSDVAARKALWDGGAAALAQSQDPMIQLARAVDPVARDIRRQYEDDVEAVEKRNQELIAQALFKQYGTSLYPDATFTLRLSYGEVRGWDEGGNAVPSFTDFAGLFERNTGAPPFALPQRWIARKDALNGATRLDFVTTNDIIGGNSGSPVINRNAEIVGLIFDGNIHSLGGAFWYDERLNRAVAVHPAAIIEALKKIYGAGGLARELVGK